MPLSAMALIRAALAEPAACSDGSRPRRCVAVGGEALLAARCDRRSCDAAPAASILDSGLLLLLSLVVFAAAGWLLLPLLLRLAPPGAGVAGSVWSASASAASSAAMSPAS